MKSNGLGLIISLSVLIVAFSCKIDNEVLGKTVQPLHAFLIVVYA